MAQGSIRKRMLDDGTIRWDVVVDLLPDPVTGKRRQRRKTFNTKKEARVGLNGWLAEIDKETVVDRSRQTVAELMTYWLETYARHNVRPATFEGYELNVRVHIIPTLGNIPVQKLSPARLQSFYSDKLAAGCGVRTIQLCHLHMSQALKQAVKLGLLVRNVAEAVTPPRKQVREMATWDVEQQRRFLAAAMQSNYGPIWVVFLTTGMRRGEVLGLRWQDVDVERSALYVRQTVGVLRGSPEIKPPKTKSSRRDVVVEPELLALLQEHKRRQNEHRLSLGEVWQDYDLVFPTNIGTPINPNNLDRDFDRWVRAAPVPRIRIHDLRHSHATLAIQEGANIKALSERLGHANIGITLGTYVHTLAEQHADVSRKVGVALFGSRREDRGGDDASLL